MVLKYILAILYRRFLLIAMCLKKSFHILIVIELFKGALSWEFRRFLAQTILKLVVANLIHSEHYL